ncbi:MAG: TIM barrel protein [Thermoproteota archaeon]
MKLDNVLSRIGFHSVYEKSIREAVDLAYKHGFSSVQVETAMPIFFPEKYTFRARREIATYAADRNIVLKIHAPGEDFSLQTLHSPIHRAIVERLKEIIDFASDLEAKIVTIHPGVVPVFTLPGKGDVPIDVQYPQLHVQALKTALLELSDYSKGRILFCVENSPLTPTVMNVLSSMLKDNKVSLTLDLAKLYKSDGTTHRNVENFFLKNLDKVRECHLHDKTRKGGHQIIGRGFVDFKRYLKTLSNYDLEYTIEVRPFENALVSLKALRKILKPT